MAEERKLRDRSMKEVTIEGIATNIEHMAMFAAALHWLG
jgi:hypothetical protein